MRSGVAHRCSSGCFINELREELIYAAIRNMRRCKKQLRNSAYRSPENILITVTPKRDAGHGQDRLVVAIISCLKLLNFATASDLMRLAAHHRADSRSGSFGSRSSLLMQLKASGEQFSGQGSICSNGQA